MNALVQITRQLAQEVARLRFSAPVTHVYNPLSYARAPHEAYLERFGKQSGRVLLLGMNPGPFGMVQTGVPFGDVAFVRDWMKIQGEISSPADQHPQRRVEGFACLRREISGSRLWGWARSRFGEPDAFFEHFFVLNYCPLAFLEASGRNRTPDKLAAAERRALFECCDRALKKAFDALQPRLVVGVGTFARQRARVGLGGEGIPIEMMLHPSPASPQANRGWAELAEAQLVEIGALVQP